MTSVLIADDEPDLAQTFATRLKRLWPDVDIAAIAANGLEALSRIQELKPDFAFLDIRMPGLNGLEVAAAADQTRIIFVTAYDEYAVAAFERYAADYLVKPVSNARLAQCVLRLQGTSLPVQNTTDLMNTLAAGRSSYLTWVHTGAGNTTRVFAVTEVLYFQASEKYTEVVTQDGRHPIRTSLKDLLQKLDPQKFAQVHRSTIVNLARVTKLERDMFGRSVIHLRDHGDVLRVGRAYLEQFRQM